MVIDAFIFNNELDLLELRLGQLDEVVDKFVFVETDKTFMGQPKPYHYQQNRQLFEKWNHKIVFASMSLPHNGHGWTYEASPREALIRLIYGVTTDPADTLSFSDLDEIPNPEVVKSYLPAMGLRNLKQYTFYYNYNNLMNYGGRPWSRARIGSIGDIALRGGMINFRGGVGDLDPNFPSIENGGWHGSYFHPSVEKIREKVYAISHDDLHPYIQSRSDRQIAQDIIEGVDLFHRSGIGNGQYIPTGDDRTPPYFRANQERFKLFTREYFSEVNKGLLNA
jgi:hypothetical protein